MLWFVMTPALHRGVKRAQIWTSLPSTVPTAAFRPGWLWSKWLYKQCSQSKQLEVQHCRAASAGTSVPYLLRGVRFAGSHCCTRDCTDSTFHFHAVFPAHQHGGASPGSPMSPLPAGPGPMCGYQGPGEGRGCGASPTRLQGAHWQFRYHEKRWGSFCTAFIRVETRIMPFQLILKLGEFSYFWGTGPSFYPFCRGNEAWELQGVMLWGLVKYMREWLGKLGR